jgi:hypothetical protein
MKWYIKRPQPWRVKLACGAGTAVAGRSTGPQLVNDGLYKVAGCYEVKRECRELLRR